MEKFDLKKAIREWRKSFFKDPGLEENHIIELEEGLCEEIEELVEGGMSEEKAFRHAAAEVAPAKVLGSEFYKVRTIRRSGRPSWQAPRFMPPLLWHYLKISLRKIKRQKIYSFINIAGLAVGMACTFLILLWVQHELSYENFHENADDIYLVAWERLANNRHYTSTPAPLALRIKEEFPEIKNVTRIADKITRIVRYKEIVFKETEMMAADPSFFRMFTSSFIQGNSDTALTEPQTIVLTRSMTEKYFKDEDPLNKTLLVDRRSLKVVGIIEDAPDNSEIRFNGILRFNDLPNAEKQDQRWWNNFSYNTYVQVREGTDLQSLSHKLTEGMERYRPWDPYERTFYPFPLKKVHLYIPGGGGPIKYVAIFSLAALFILLISCINFINLTTARSAKRAKEVGIRKVIGSDRKLLVKQFFGESVIYVLTSFILALFLVQLVIPSFNSIVQKNLRIQLTDISFVFSLLAILLLTVVVSGFYPSLYLSSFHPVKIFRGNSSLKGKERFRQFLVIVQFAISILLMICTFVVLKQIHFMKHADLGFDQENLLSVPVDSAMSLDISAVKNDLRQQKAILDVAAPGPGSQGASLRWEGMNPDLSYLENEVRFRMVDYDFFPTMGARFVAGRNFSEEFGKDFEAGYIINEEAARLWQMDSPLGKNIDFCGRAGNIIGVVDNIHIGYRESLHAEIYYLKSLDVWDRSSTLIIRIETGGIKEAIEAVQKIWKRFNAGTPFEFSFLDQEIDETYKQEELVSRIAGYFAALSIFISCLGLFGLASFMAEQKTKEIGLRKVLGASISSIVSLLNKEFLKCVGIANIIAWPFAWIAMHRWLQTYPYRIGLSMTFFLLSALLAVLISLATVSFQAIRAALSNPSDALRFE